MTIYIKTKISVISNQITNHLLSHLYNPIVIINKVRKKTIKELLLKIKN